MNSLYYNLSLDFSLQLQNPVSKCISNRHINVSQTEPTPVLPIACHISASGNLFLLVVQAKNLAIILDFPLPLVLYIQSISILHQLYPKTTSRNQPSLIPSKVIISVQITMDSWNSAILHIQCLYFYPAFSLLST